MRFPSAFFMVCIITLSVSCGETRMSSETPIIDQEETQLQKCKNTRCKPPPPEESFENNDFRSADNTVDDMNPGETLAQNPRDTASRSEQPLPQKNCLKPSSNYLQPGPYPAASKPGPSGYTIFYPRNTVRGCKHPFVVWGNGTTQRGVAFYGGIGKHLASHGIFVIHSHADGGGGLSGAGPMKKGIDVANQLGRSGEFAGLISENGGSSGHSQGGIGAQVLGNSSPQIKAVVDMMGGGVAGSAHSKPTLLLTGSMDFMLSSINQAFSSLRGRVFLANFSGVEHNMGPMTTPGFKASSAAWFRCFLARDLNACRIFQGQGNSSIFGNAEVRKKNF